MSLKEFRHLRPGEQVNLNHPDCPAGRDTRKRWYVKRTDDGQRIVAFCHNCGEKDSIRASGFAIPATPAPPAIPGKLSLPSDFEPNTSLWPSEALAWVLKAGLDFADVKLGGLGFSKYLNRLVLPVWRDGGLKGYQSRSFVPGADKYITKVLTKPLRGLYTGSKSPEVLVICEDLLSAYRVAKVGYTGFACMRSGVGCSEIYALSKTYRQAVVWLDNDKPEVLANSRKLLRYSEMFFDKAAIVQDLREPKRYSDTEIERRISDALK